MQCTFNFFFNFTSDKEMYLYLLLLNIDSFDLFYCLRLPFESAVPVKFLAEARLFLTNLYSSGVGGLIIMDTRPFSEFPWKCLAKKGNEEGNGCRICEGLSISQWQHLL